VAKSNHANSERTIQMFAQKKKHVKQQNFSQKVQLVYCGSGWAVLLFTYIMGAQIIQNSRRNLKILLPEL